MEHMFLLIVIACCGLSWASDIGSCSSSQYTRTENDNYKCQLCFSKDGTYQSCTKTECEEDIDTYKCTNQQTVPLLPQQCEKVCCPGLLIAHSSASNNQMTPHQWSECKGLLDKNQDKRKIGIIVGVVIAGIMLLGFSIWVIFIIKNKNSQTSAFRDSADGCLAGDPESQSSDTPPKTHSRMVRQIPPEFEQPDTGVDSGIKGRHFHSNLTGLIDSSDNPYARRAKNMTGLPFNLRELEMTPPNQTINYTDSYQ